MVADLSTASSAHCCGGKKYYIGTLLQNLEQNQALEKVLVGGRTFKPRSGEGCENDRLMDRVGRVRVAK